MSGCCGVRDSSSCEVLQAEGNRNLSVVASGLQLREVTSAMLGGKEVARRGREYLFINHCK